jgi:hypothetical protein
MVRRSLHLLALAAAAALVATDEAAAGACCECTPPCAPAQVVEVVEAHAATPFYVVNHGPVYAGPGIMSIPITYAVHKGPRDYPYVGRDYRYHRHHHDVTLWQKSRMVYVDVKAPRRVVVSHRPRMTPYRSAPRQMMRPPLDPRDK